MPPTSEPFKICPRCQTPAPLTTPQCVQCGRQYNTQFTQVVAPPQTTQKFTPPPASAQTQVLGVHQSLPIGAYGPKDRLEWNVSAFWHWLGLYLCAGFALGSGWYFVRFADLLPWGKEYWLLLLALAVFGASFCALRLRRLYVYFAAERRPWWLSAGLICALILVPLGWREYQYQEYLIEMHQREVAQEQRAQEQQQEMALSNARMEELRASINESEARLRAADEKRQAEAEAAMRSAQLQQMGTARLPRSYDATPAAGTSSAGLDMRAPRPQTLHLPPGMGGNSSGGGFGGGGFGGGGFGGRGIGQGGSIGGGGNNQRGGFYNGF